MKAGKPFSTTSVATPKPTRNRAERDVFLHDWDAVADQLLTQPLSIEPSLRSPVDREPLPEALWSLRLRGLEFKVTRNEQND